MLTKHEILLGRGTRMESSRERDPRRTALLGSAQWCGRALEPGTAPTEPTCFESVAQHEEPLQEEAPLAASREKPIAAAKTQHGPK